MGKLEEFLGCMIKCVPTKKNLNIYQLHIINKMTQGFNKYVKSLMILNTPDTPHKGILSKQEIDVKIPYDLQNIYRSDVVSLQRLLKHSRHKLSNTVCELSKFM